MKKIITLLVVLSLASVGVVTAMEPLDPSVYAELETSDIFGEGDFGLALNSGVEAALGKTGFSFAADMVTPLTPDFTLIYTLAIEEEYDFDFSGIAFEVSNTNTLYIDDPAERDTNGYITLDGTWKFVNAGIELYYMPDTALDIYGGPVYSKKLGKGTIDLSATIYYLIQPEAMLGDIKGEAKYTMAIKKFDVYGAVKPTLNEDGAGDRKLGCTLVIGGAYKF